MSKTSTGTLSTFDTETVPKYSRHDVIMPASQSAVLSTPMNIHICTQWRPMAKWSVSSHNRTNAVQRLCVCTSQVATIFCVK